MNLGTLFGIKLRVHWSFVLLPLWVYSASLLSGTGAAAAIMSVLFVLAIFGCVLLHELGHALAARQVGVGTRDITLYPIGGVAMLESMPRRPPHELWIAVAGPLVNVIIAASIFAALAVGLVPSSNAFGEIMTQLAYANMALVVFNMIPAFPMDGGRVFRSVLAMLMSYETATRVAVIAGQFLAITLAILGLLSGNIMLGIIGLFIYFAAGAENQYVQSVGVPRETLEFESQRVPASLSVAVVSAWLTSQRRDWCEVVRAGQVVGRISRGQLIAATHRGLGERAVGDLVGV